MIDYRQPENGLRLAKRIAHSCAMRSMREFQADELEGVATDALMEALRKDTGVGNFKAFLNRIVRARIVDYKRKHGPFTRSGWVRALPRPHKPRPRKLTLEECSRIRSATLKRTWKLKREQILATRRATLALRTPEEKRAIGRKINATRKANYEARNRNSGAASRATAA